MFKSLIDAGAEYIQVDEPILVTERQRKLENITREAYGYFRKKLVLLKISHSNIL